MDKFELLALDSSEIHVRFWFVGWGGRAGQQKVHIEHRESPMKPKVEEATASNGSAGDKAKSSKSTNESRKEYIRRTGSEVW
jgi:hypothetical protein